MIKKVLTPLADKALDVLPESIRLGIACRILQREIGHVDLDTARAIVANLDFQCLRLEDQIRRLSTPGGRVPGYAGAPGAPPLERSIMQDDRPWRGMACPRFDIPGMISEEEIQYYHWLAPYYSGEHAVVELGPWLGHSTVHLATALAPTLQRHCKRLHVYDDFVWRTSWMNRHLRPHDPPAPAQHESFEHLFWHFASGVRELLDVQRGKIADYDGNENLSPISWNGGPIELLIVDCGRTIKANQAWLDLLAPSFLPNRTLIVMQDWRLHRERPRQPYNQTLLFTQVNPRLELVHEIMVGGIATFLYR